MRRLNDDDGAVAVIVALLAVVLFGFAALVIDVGRCNDERRQLQNGADGAASRWRRPAPLARAERSLPAEPRPSLRDGNARDAAANLREICGSGDAALAPAWSPPACPCRLREGAHADGDRVRCRQDASAARALLGRQLHGHHGRRHLDRELGLTPAR
jgi:hypothetical protein